MTERRMIERRASDQAVKRLKIETRVLYAIMAVAVVVAAVILDHQANTQREGRATALDVTCSAIGAISEAGRSVIVGSAETPRERRAANIAAQGYVASIGRQVEKKSGITNLILPDGRLDCERLKDKARVR